MTDIDLPAILARTNAATPAPWTADGLEGTLNARSGRVAEFTMWGESDAQFIAASRTDVPALVAVIRAVLDIHERIELFDGTACLECDVTWPCATVQAIEAPNHVPLDNGGHPSPHFTVRADGAVDQHYDLKTGRPYDTPVRVIEGNTL